MSLPKQMQNRLLAESLASCAPASSWRIGFANSMRAMLRCPEVAKAWMNYGTTVRQSAAIDREIQLQVSFAVSMANGCRYCTLHQVLGLRRLGVSMTKLMEMKKDDDALTPREKVAVLFARKLTKDPVSLADTDYQGLRAEFGDRGALDVLLQTSAFSFMNRFTDGLRLPSEDEAIRVYREVYGIAPAE
jgi:AhpD family alkylhydroperoxidase